MKKVLLVVLAVILALGMFAGCSKTEEPAAAEDSVTTIDSEPDVEEAPAPAVEATESPAPGTPENISPTTGLENTTTEYKPVIVQLGNEPHERPQTYIQLADVVYETPIEGIDTRFTALFNDALWSPGAASEIVVGPVRSSRYYHQWIQSEWDALYVHMGGPDATGNPESDIWAESNNHIKQRINGAGKHAVNSDMFTILKPGQSISNYAGTDIVEDAGIYKYEPKALQKFTYYPLTDYADKPEATDVQLSFYGGKPAWAGFDYDSAKDKLIRYATTKSGKTTLVDEGTGQPVEVQNLIIQFTTVQPMPNDPPVRMEVDMFGEGPAEFIIHGKHIEGTWERKDKTVPTTYKDSEGKEIIFTPGNTWVAVHPNTTPVVIKYADGTEYNSHKPAKSDD